MKTTLFILGLCILPVAVWSQTVDGVDLGKIPSIQYIEILGVNKGLFQKKIVVVVDYGQKIEAFETDTRVQGADGKPVVFNSMMDAVNRFYFWGWDLMFAYDVSSGQGGTVYHYVLKRRMPGVAAPVPVVAPASGGGN